MRARAPAACDRAPLPDEAELVHRTVLPATRPRAVVDTDEWNASKPLERCGRDMRSAV
jgi:hypothetical protein